MSRSNTLGNRYFLDALYGRMCFPGYVWQAVLAPEVQRLREIRLCNINSLALTGGANINRFEHSLGCTRLALEFSDVNAAELTPHDRKVLVLAALLHDVTSTAFGHSVQYVLDRQGFRHDWLAAAFSPYRDQVGGNSLGSSFSYQDTALEPIFFGSTRQVANILDDAELQAISRLVAGEGPLGPVINGSLDLDNVDNVFRLAYHLGLRINTQTPLKIARSVWVRDSELRIDESDLTLIEEWYETRRQLYTILLENPDEFSAKCMLEEALLHAQTIPELAFKWYDTDYQLLEKLSRADAVTSTIVRRLMIGDLYGCVGLFSTPWFTKKEHALVELRSMLEAELKGRFANVPRLRDAIPAVHLIADVNKTCRSVHILTSDGKRRTIGETSKRLLVGIFLKNRHLNMSGLTSRKPQEVESYQAIAQGAVESALGGEVTALRSYSEESSFLT